MGRRKLSAEERKAVSIRMKKLWASKRKEKAREEATPSATKKAKRMPFRVTTLHYVNGNLIREVHKFKSYGELLDLVMDMRASGNDFEEVHVERG